MPCWDIRARLCSSIQTRGDSSRDLAALPHIQNQEKAPLPSSCPHGATFSLENFISLAPCPLACKVRPGLVPSTHQMLRTGKNPSTAAEDEGLGRPRVVAPVSGDQQDWQKYPEVFFTGVTVQCSPNEKQRGGAEPGGNYSCSRAHLRGLTVLPWGLAVPRSHGEGSWKWRKVGMAGTQETPCFGHFPILSSPWKCPKNVDVTLEDMGG